MPTMQAAALFLAQSLPRVFFISASRLQLVTGKKSLIVTFQSWRENLVERVV